MLNWQTLGYSGVLGASIFEISEKGKENKKVGWKGVKRTNVCIITKIV